MPIEDDPLFATQDQRQRGIFEMWEEVRRIADFLSNDSYFDEMLEGLDTSHTNEDRDAMIAGVSDNKDAAVHHLEDLAAALEDLLPEDVFNRLQKKGRP